MKPMYFNASMFSVKPMSQTPTVRVTLEIKKDKLDEASYAILSALEFDQTPVRVKLEAI